MDPLGANLLRNMLLAWKKKNVTVVLNSHHLDEVERVCDRVAFIKGGRIQQIENISSISSQELNVIVRCSEELAVPPDAVLREIASTICGELIDCTDHTLRFRLKQHSDKAQLVRLLVEHKVAVEEVFQEKRGLEDLFISIHKEEGVRK
jgi:ABC-2 type transport system ATP-binding protein